MKDKINYEKQECPLCEENLEFNKDGCMKNEKNGDIIYVFTCEECNQAFALDNDEEYEDNDEEYEDNDDEDSGGLMLSIGAGGKASLIKQSDYENTIENQQKIITEFIKDNVDLFNKFLKKKGISEEDFNGEFTNPKQEVMEEGE